MPEVKQTRLSASRRLSIIIERYPNENGRSRNIAPCRAEIPEGAVTREKEARLGRDGYIERGISRSIGKSSVCRRRSPEICSGRKARGLCTTTSKRKRGRLLSPLGVCQVASLQIYNAMARRGVAVDREDDSERSKVSCF